VLAASRGGTLRVVATHDKSGFETPIGTPSGDDTYAVHALDAGGRVIGASKPFAARDT
jgi:hypothetical protein